MNAPKQWTPTQLLAFKLLLGDAVKESFDRRFGVKVGDDVAQKLGTELTPSKEG